MKRYGMVIRVKANMVDEYKRLHANAWPEVLAMIRACNIRNYSIYLKGDFLFSYFEYHGNDFAGDMATMAEDPVTQRWWALTDPCQMPVDDRKPGEWWAEMDEVFHCD